MTSNLTFGEIMAYEQRQQDRNEAYSDGLDANINGVFSCDNPHPAGSRKHEAWYDGWLDGQAIRQDWEELCDGRD